MGKGSKGSTATPVTNSAAQTNPLAQYVEGTAKRLAPIAEQGPYTAPPNPYQLSGYPNLATTGYNIAAPGGLQTNAYDAYGAAQRGAELFGSGSSGPAQSADQVTNFAVNNAINYANPIADYANQAAGSNVGQDQLARVAQGDYTNAASNPYLRDMVNAALRPVSEQYGTVTAPGLASRFSAGGRYGSGAQDVAESSARDAFARNLGEISTGMYGNEYRFERGQQDNAATAYDQARQRGLGLGITGLNTAGGLVDQGERTALSAADLNQRGQIAGIQSGFQGTQQYPQFANAQFIMPRAEIEAGAGLRDLDTSVLREPYDRANAFLKSISGAGANAAGSSGSSTTPYYSNDVASAISGLSGAASLGKQLGIGDLFGAGAGGAGSVGSVLSGIGSGALPAVLAPDIGAAGLSSLAAMNAGTSIAPALAAAGSAAFTIICTELVRQGRMPDTWRRAGMRQFMRYPAIARRGYWVWATPVVAHLRKKPDSRFSKCIEKTFNWRAEDLAARAGVKGARRLLRGRLVTAAMVIPCLACGLVARRDYFPDAKDAPA